MTAVPLDTAAPIDPAVFAGIDHYRRNPCDFTADVFGEPPWSIQRRVLEALEAHRLVAVIGCHGFGKSWLASRWAVKQFCTNDPIFIALTAPTSRQVKNVVWREIRKAYYKARERGLLLHPRPPLRTLQWEVDAGHVMMGFSSDDPSKLQGIHERRVCLVLDEAAGIPAELWPALDSILTGEDCQCLAIGNPDTNDCELRKRVDSGDWHVIHVSAFDTPNFTGEEVPPELASTLVSLEYERRIKSRYGADSPIYASKVLGQWPRTGTDVVVPAHYIEAMTGRDAEPGEVSAAGIDVALQGGDKSALAVLSGNTLRIAGTWQIDNAEELCATLDAKLRETGAKPGSTRVAVDADGFGKPVADKLSLVGWDIHEFHGAAEPEALGQESDAVEFLNLRASAYWGFRCAARDWLRIEEDQRDSFDGFSDISHEFKAVARRVVLKIEAKDEIRKRRGGSSPDEEDAAVMCLWASRQVSADWTAGVAVASGGKAAAPW